MFQVVQRIVELRAARAAEMAQPCPEFSVTPWQRALELSAVRLATAGGLMTAPALLMSLLAHVSIAVVLAFLPLGPGGESLGVQLISTFMEEDVPVEELVEFDLARPDDQSRPNITSSLALAASPLPTNEEDLLSETPPNSLIVHHEVTRQSDPLKGLVHTKVVSKGTVGEEVKHLDGAVDRITFEICMHLEERPVLVVWLMDASISLIEERQDVADRIDRIYSEIQQSGSLSRNSLLAAVMSYGESHEFLLDPTADGGEVSRAMRGVKVDESGVENVFAAVIAAVDRYRFHSSRERRKIVLVNWTDESGDDYALLEKAVSTCQRYNVQVLTVGPSAMFGKEQGSRSYTHPDDGKVYQLPLNRGPDAVYQEGIQLPYWFGGGQFDNLHASIGPFALSRLARETGGAYFIKDQPGDGSPFDLRTMLRYAPDYGSVDEYVRQVRSSPLRTAVIRAAEVTRKQRYRPMPPMEFEPTGSNYQQLLVQAQQTVAYNSPLLDEALACFGRNGLEREYQAEPSRRWRAWYDLSYGRLLAMKVRHDEYNWFCAELKGKGREFVDERSNRWKLEPDAKLRFGTASERMAAEARRLLQRCVDENPGTPWAQLAQRELKDPLGFRMVERYVPPPPPRPANAAAGNNPPPPQGRRDIDQLRQLDRPKPVVLPKL